MRLTSCGVWTVFSCGTCLYIWRWRAGREHQSGMYPPAFGCSPESSISESPRPSAAAPLIEDVSAVVTMAVS